VSKKSLEPLDPQTIDALYWLEPVFEPGGPAAAVNATEFVSVQCPYCGERFETAVDLSAVSFSYVEDGQVCCQPIELTSELTDRGAFAGSQHVQCCGGRPPAHLAPRPA
jgi:Cysteine-rich CPXCG